jgi:two-component system sensor histidine kinase PilS (NtrC family)
MSAAVGPNGPFDDWARLKTLIWSRLLIVSLALPLGVGLRTGATAEAWEVVVVSLLVVGAVSALFWGGTLLRRGFGFQLGFHLGVDVALVTALAALTGGRSSQFVLFYPLVSIAGGVLGGLRGGFTGALGSCLGFIALPWVTGPVSAGAVQAGMAVVPRPEMLMAVLATVGVLAGFLGARVRNARQRLERASRELDRLRLDNDVILRHLTTGVITLDDTAAVAFLNPAAEEMLEVKLDGVRGRPVAVLPERLAPLRDALLAVLERRRPQHRGELRMVTSTSHPLPVGISTNVLTQEERVTGVVAVFQDLTEVREMEERARRNQTLAEVGALAAGIAHELRNGLNPISGSVECLQRELKLEGENAQLMELIATESQRLNRFVTDLLSYSRDREPVKQALDLNEQLSELCDGLTRDPRCRPGTQIRFLRGPAEAELLADREQLRQVWLNLGANALEAMDRGGTLTVRWLEVDAEHVAVEFIDSGPGIAAAHLPRVGQPFFTTKQGGTGLGLAIAQRIIERHGGTLRFESPPGHGTTARVTLPSGAVEMAQAA